MEKKSFNLIIGTTGSVAALKLPVLEESLHELNLKLEQYKLKVICLSCYA